MAGRVTLLLDRDAVVRADVGARGAGLPRPSRPGPRGRAGARGELMPGHLVQQADVHAERRRRRRRDAHDDRWLVRLQGARAERRELPDRALAGLGDGRPRAVDVRALGHRDALPRRPRAPRADARHGRLPRLRRVVLDRERRPRSARRARRRRADARRRRHAGAREPQVHRQLRDAARRGGRHRPHVPAARRSRRRLRGLHAVHGRDPRRPRARPQPHLRRGRLRRRGRGLPAHGRRDAPDQAGSCIYLPPLHMHCLENTGQDRMRVLGVFQPAGSPAARYAEEA